MTEILTFKSTFAGEEYRVEYRGKSYIIPKKLFPLIRQIARDSFVTVKEVL